MVLSPTYRQAKNVWSHIAYIVRNCRHWCLPGKKGIRWSNEEKEIRFINGAKIIFRSADIPAGIRSDGVAWLLVDEWQDVGEAAYGNAHLSLSEGGDDYRIIGTATIKPEFRDRHDKIAASKLGRILRMRSRGNPFIGHAMFDEASEFLDSAMVQRELEAEWPELAGRIYYPFHPDHVKTFPLVGKRECTAQELHERYDTHTAADTFISVDPPHYAVLWKMYEDGTLHAVDEALIRSDGVGGDIKDLARTCGARAPQGGAVVFDPHDHKWGPGARDYFSREGFRIVFCPKVNVEYRITSVRSRLERGKLFVDPKCRHLIEVLNEHVYRDGKPCKKSFYRKAHAKLSQKIELVHLADAMGYGVYKLWPSKRDYEADEERIAA